MALRQLLTALGDCPAAATIAAHSGGDYCVASSVSPNRDVRTYSWLLLLLWRADDLPVFLDRYNDISESEEGYEEIPAFEDRYDFESTLEKGQYVILCLRTGRRTYPSFRAVEADTQSGFWVWWLHVLQ